MLLGRFLYTAARTIQHDMENLGQISEQNRLLSPRHSNKMIIERSINHVIDMNIPEQSLIIKNETKTMDYDKKTCIH